MKFRCILVVLLVLAVLPASFHLWWSYPGWLWYIHPGSPAAALNKASKAAPYQVIDDDMGSYMSIAVPYDVTTEQLQATLVKVANEHQDDLRRDYLMSIYLGVDAFLARDGRQSKQAAGHLRRYVPWTNPEKRKKMRVDRTMFDKLDISLDQARQTIK
ncbi:MAG: hypothetical protein ACXVK3_11960 [Candidatus Angelobacter sp.]